jgi:hypothetical protein
MKKLASRSAVAALAALAIPAGTAAAATIEITGNTYSGFPGYGNSLNVNNVVNAPGSGLTASFGPNPWKYGGSVLSEVAYYEVDWYFNGAESGNTNKFFSAGISFAEANQNNNYNPGNDGGWQSLGTTSGSGLGAPIPFQVTDTNFATGNTIVDGTNHVPGPNVASMIYSYAKPKFNRKGELVGWKLTTTETDWFVFAFDDPGSKNDDHDDFVGVARVREVAGPPSPVPLPGALPLMGTVVGGGFLLRRWRSYRSRRTSVDQSV